ncbi:MAG: hypothetical protein LLP51_01075 [Halorhodospira halophila]|uniref:hypothetical protein n=1 Tax=Halorhodospira TaxID=85108 RepID=UPI0019138636|nr:MULTISPECIES: hypothetical protein [Halorhodospira]MBK5936044.1 hypothetical protein [Halorhodospira halophila]MBK5943705.1 hypothetical protein [Halorhodospira halophila]MCC3749972.1 hypothetical protein [Halorhodospira halophila]MCG5528334.1 hypothetical protein [Halorhodospira halophila]MCG5532128.1 hypothetical protein [Halorhodospira sp. 9621]
MSEPEQTPETEEHVDPQSLGVDEIVEQMRIVRVRYTLADTSAYVRYLPRFNPQPEDLTVHVDPFAEHHEGAEITGEFRLPELVNELIHAYIRVHVFASREQRNYFVGGFDDALTQLDFVGGGFGFNRLWITVGTTNIGMPVCIYLGQRTAVNRQPTVSLVDHRENPRGDVVYRAVGGYGDHVGEEYF